MAVSKITHSFPAPYSLHKELYKAHQLIENIFSFKRYLSVITDTQLKWTDAALSLSLCDVIIAAMHDGIYCLGSDHPMYTRFCIALWDTLSALYSGHLHSLVKYCM